MRRSVPRRCLAAVWFAAFGALATFAFFLPLSMRAHVAFLYVGLPSLSAGIAGYVWGGAILDATKVRTYAGSLLRGVAVAIGAYAIFALFFSCGLPLLEAGGSLRQVPGLLLATLTLGLLLLGGPIVLVGGMIAGTALFALSSLAVKKTVFR